MGWCSRCYQINVRGTGDGGREVYFDGYLQCHYCPGVCLPLPHNFTRYAEPAMEIFAQQPSLAGRLFTLAGVIGQARADYAAVTPGADPVATVAAVAPGLESILTEAREDADLGAALLTVWILVGELRLATGDQPLPASLDEWRGLARLRSLNRAIAV